MNPLNDMRYSLELSRESFDVLQNSTLFKLNDKLVIDENILKEIIMDIAKERKLLTYSELNELFVEFDKTIHNKAIPQMKMNESYSKVLKI